MVSPNNQFTNTSQICSAFVNSLKKWSVFALIMHIYAVFLQYQSFFFFLSKKLAYNRQLERGGGSRPQRTRPLKMQVIFDVLPWCWESVQRVCVWCKGKSCKEDQNQFSDLSVCRSWQILHQMKFSYKPIDECHYYD